jgi:hypothetical protein
MTHDDNSSSTAVEGAGRRWVYMVEADHPVAGSEVLLRGRGRPNCTASRPDLSHSSRFPRFFP